LQQERRWPKKAQAQPASELPVWVWELAQVGWEPLVAAARLRKQVPLQAWLRVPRGFLSLAPELLESAPVRARAGLPELLASFPPAQERGPLRVLRACPQLVQAREPVLEPLVLSPEVQAQARPRELALLRPARLVAVREHSLREHSLRE
jgi:hypothetical protein